jgi:hypothetical protein
MWYGESIKGVMSELTRDKKNKELKRLFSHYAHKRSLRAYELDIGYLQPPLDLKTEKEAIREDLVFVLRGEYQWAGETEKTLTRSEVLNILSFIYREVYVDSYLGQPEYESYRALMERMYCTFAATLSPITNLKPL